MEKIQVYCSEEHFLDYIGCLEEERPKSKKE